MVTVPRPVSRQLYDAARTAVVAFERRDQGWLSVTGGDRGAFLHGLFTNDIAALAEGRGCYSAYLTPQGRMLSDFRVYELGDRLLLGLDHTLAPAMATRLEQLIFAEDVHVADVTGTFSSVVLAGPEGAASTAALIQGLAPGELSGLPVHGNRQGRFAGGVAVVLRVDDLGEPGYEIVVSRAHSEALQQALERQGVPLGGEALSEMLRIEGGIPKFLRDMDRETIPLEAGIESRAISMTKGCYVGQEVIVRVLHRGHGRVAERLVTLEVEGSEVPSPGTAVEAGDRKIGRITSSTMSLALGRPIALAYLQRDYLSPGTAVGVGTRRAVVRTGPAVLPSVTADG